MTDMTVAKTILEQLGGRKFTVMTGAKNYIGDANSLTFRLPGAGGFCKDGINVVKVTLDPSDTYTVVFSRLRGAKLTVVSQSSDVYADVLQDVFTRATGLATSLGTMGVKPQPLFPASAERAFNNRAED